MNILDYDQRLLLAVNSFFVGRSGAVDEIVKFCAVYLVYALPIVLLLLWFIVEKRREPLFLSFLGGVFSWFVITKSIVPAIWFRPRPQLSLLGAEELLFHRPDYSFPSDHATVLYALVFGFYIFGWKKAANWFLIYALIITICRVAVGVHYPLDILAGALSGFIGVILVKLLRKQIVKYVYTPIVSVLKKVHLA